MQYKFRAYGHPNILGTHKTTLEFTKDSELTLKGDCIIGVNADFDLKKLKNFIKKIKSAKLTIKIDADGGKISDTIAAEINKDFKNKNEFVVRKSEFISERTFAIRANKSAFQIKRKLISYLSEEGGKILIEIKSRA